MVYTLKEFAQLNFSKEPLESDHAIQCCNCSIELRENISGYRLGVEGPHCSDCYFDKLSNVIDIYPVGVPGVRR